MSVFTNKKINVMFRMYERKEWWPYVAEVVLEENGYRDRTVRLLQCIDREYAAWIGQQWQLTLFCFCVWLDREEWLGRGPVISGVEDVVCGVDNWVVYLFNPNKNNKQLCI